MFFPADGFDAHDLIFLLNIIKHTILPYLQFSCRQRIGPQFFPMAGWRQRFVRQLLFDSVKNRILLIRLKEIDIFESARCKFHFEHCTLTALVSAVAHVWIACYRTISAFRWECSVEHAERVAEHSSINLRAEVR